MISNSNKKHYHLNKYPLKNIHWEDDTIGFSLALKDNSTKENLQHTDTLGTTNDLSPEELAKIPEIYTYLDELQTEADKEYTSLFKIKSNATDRSDKPEIKALKIRQQKIPNKPLIVSTLLLALVGSGMLPYIMVSKDASHANTSNSISASKELSTDANSFNNNANAEKEIKGNSNSYKYKKPEGKVTVSKEVREDEKKLANEEPQDTVNNLEDTSTLKSTLSVPKTTKQKQPLSKDNAVKDNAIEKEVAKHTVRDWIATEKDNGMSYFTLGLMNKNKLVYPVTFKIDKDVFYDYLDGKKPTQVSIYNTFSQLIDEKNIDATEFLPYSGEISDTSNKNKHTIQLQLDKTGEKIYKSKSNINTLMKSLSITFSEYTKVSVIDSSGNPYILSSLGTNIIPLKNGHYSYYYNKDREGFVLGDGTQYNSVAQALNALKGGTLWGNRYTSTVLSDISYTVSVSNNKLVTVKFKKPLNLEKAYKENHIEDIVHMIEAMRLTVSSFHGYTIKFENTQYNVLNGVDLTKPLPAVIGTNMVKLK